MNHYYENRPSTFGKWMSRLVLGVLFLGLAVAAYFLIPLIRNAFGGSPPAPPPPAQAENPSVQKAAKISTDVARRIAIHNTLPERSMLGIGFLHEGQDTNSATMQDLIQTLAIELSNSQALGTLRTLVETRAMIKEQSELAKSIDPKVAKEAAKQLEKLENDKAALIEHLRETLNTEGFELTAEQVEALAASPNAEDLATLITSFQALRLVTMEMEDRLRVAPSAALAKDYYGSYSVLLIVMDKIQNKAMQNIQKIYIPKADSLAAEAQHVIDHAKETLQRRNTLPLGSEEKQSLQFNIATNEESQRRAHRLRAKLEKNLSILREANLRLKNSIEAAANSHRTMLVRTEIDRLDLHSTREFEEIQKLVLPPMAALNFADPDRPEVSPRKTTVLD